MGRPDANPNPSQFGNQINQQQRQQHHFQTVTQSPETIDDEPPFEAINEENQEENYGKEPSRTKENGKTNQQTAQSSQKFQPTPPANTSHLQNQTSRTTAFPPQSSQANAPEAVRFPPQNHQSRSPVSDINSPQTNPQAFAPRPQAQPQAFPPSESEAQAFPPSQGEPQAFPPLQDEPQAFPPAQHEPQAFPPEAFPPPQGGPHAFPPPQDEPQAFPPPQSETQAFPPPQDEPQAFPPPQSETQAFPPPQDEPQAFSPPQSQAQASPSPQQASFPNSNMAHAGSSQVLPNPPVIITMPGIPNQWKTGLFECMNEPGNALITVCFPCVTFGQIAELVDSGQTSCASSGLLYGVIACCIAMPCLLSCRYRTKLRSRFGLIESPAPDWIVHCICGYCALCQEYRELQLRGLDPSIGWQGNVIRVQNMVQASAMTPPTQQTMTG